MAEPEKTDYRLTEIKGGISVYVPDNNTLMTPYILQEQEDWFEDEIEFLRGYLREGMNIIDIGASYGVYTLTAALLTGNNGCVYSFEPTSSVFSCLKRSKEVNRLPNLYLFKKALSDNKGVSSLSLNPNPELNSLSPDGTDKKSGTEEVEVTTLDSFSKENSIKGIDFIKLDAEGKEVEIINGARKSLERFSPLIMYEIRHGETYNNDLAKTLQDLGYYSYRLLPGPKILVPFTPSSEHDPFLLNLFACKQDTVSLLESQGFLAESRSINDSESDPYVTADDPALWEKYLSSLRYSQKFIPYWKTPGKGQRNSSETKETIEKKYTEILNLYAVSRDKGKEPAKRYICIRKAFKKIQEITQTTKSLPFHLTAARISFDAGERKKGVEYLGYIINNLKNLSSVNPDMPFIPVIKEYEAIPPENPLINWILSSVLEGYLEKHAFSTYFSKDEMLPVLKKLSELGYTAKNIRSIQDLIRENTSSREPNK
ncbi:MAG: FkbM family methyltransferase [Chitinivibrionales bacterium]